MMKANQSVIYVKYSYLDSKKNKKIAYALVNNFNNSLNQATIYYLEDKSLILEYLPGDPITPHASITTPCGFSLQKINKKIICFC